MDNSKVAGPISAGGVSAGLADVTACKNWQVDSSNSVLQSSTPRIGIPGRGSTPHSDLNRIHPDGTNFAAAKATPHAIGFDGTTFALFGYG